MKKIIITTSLFLLGVTAFCQEENGIIYIKHPYIDVVNQANKDYTANDMTTAKNYYSDTAKWWISGLTALPTTRRVRLQLSSVRY